MPGIFRRDHSQELVRAGEAQRNAQAQVVFEAATMTEEQELVIQAAYAAMTEAGFPLTVESVYDKKSETTLTTVATNTTEQRKATVESALFNGLTTALNVQLGDMRPDPADPTALFQTAQEIAKRDLGQIVGDSPLYELFTQYYGGLRWSSDQEKLVRGLFEHAATFDPVFLDENVTSDEVVGVVYMLEADIPYTEYRQWREGDPAEVFEQHPELDYHRLEDTEFRDTPEGKALKDAYTKLSGQMMAQRYQNYDRKITDDGQEVPKPRIPLAHFPVIEGLMVDEVSMAKPSAAYSMGPREVIDMILDSDSEPAADAIVQGINTRLPEDERFVFDGPSEFQHKRGAVASVLRAYENSYEDASARARMRERIETIYEAYTGHGPIAESHRVEVQTRRDGWHPETGRIRETISDIVTVMLASPDAEGFVAKYLPEDETNLVGEIDPLMLTEEEMATAVLDATKRLTALSQPAVFERLGTRIFNDESMGRRLRHIANLRVQAAELREQPEFMLALRGIRKHSISIGDEKAAARNARLAFDEASRPSEKLYAQATEEMNALLLDNLQLLADSGRLDGGMRTPGRLFEEFVKRVSLGDTSKMHVLPASYDALVELSEHPNVTDNEKSAIAWHFAEQMRYTDEEACRLLLPVVLDIYQMALGPAESIRPSRRSDHILAAASTIVYNNSVFEHASEADLLTLSRYKATMVDMLEQAVTGRVLPGEPIGPEVSEAQDRERVYELQHIVRTMERIEEQYAQYLHLEDVKVLPNVYYPWLMQQFVPFWQKMNWEVGPGNMPRPDIQALYEVLADHVSNKLVLHDGAYPESFDCLAEGNLGSLLLEGYDRMVKNHEIQYNTTVWQDGLRFMHYACGYMPASVLEQLKAAHPDRPDFLSYVESVRTRYNPPKDPNAIVVLNGR